MPQTIQTRDEHQLAQQLLKHWSITPRGVELITNETNAMFRVDTADGQCFALRIGHTRVCHDQDETRSELAWLAALDADTDLFVPRVVRTIDDDVLVPIENAGPWRNATLFEWMPGETVGEDLTEASAGAIGVLMADLHEHAGGFKLPDGCRVRRGDRVLPWSSRDFTCREPVLLFEERHRELYMPKMREAYEQGYALADHAISTLWASGVTPRLIHNDFHPWNLRRHEQRVGALDFEDLVLGYPVQDIATFWYYLTLREDGEQLAFDFRDGYESRRPWPVESAGRLHTLVIGRGLVLANFLLAGIDDYGPEKVRDWLERIGQRLVLWTAEHNRS